MGAKYPIAEAEAALGRVPARPPAIRREALENLVRDYGWFSKAWIELARLHNAEGREDAAKSALAHGLELNREALCGLSGSLRALAFKVVQERDWIAHDLDAALSVTQATERQRSLERLARVYPESKRVDRQLVREAEIAEQIRMSEQPTMLPRTGMPPTELPQPPKAEQRRGFEGSSSSHEQAMPRQVGPYRILGRRASSSSQLLLDAVDALGDAVLLRLRHDVSPAVARLQFRLEASGAPKSAVVTARLGAVENGDDVYQVLGSTDGIPLTDVVAKGPTRKLAPSVAIEIALAITEALGVLHSQVGPHGDLRPDHILIAQGKPNWRVQFLTANRVVRMSSGTVALDAASSLWEAPEIAQTGPSVRTDLYSLGLIVRHLLTGLDPQPHGQQARSATLLVSDEGIVVELNAVIGRCTQVEPSARYESAFGVRDDLRRILPPTPQADAEAHAKAIPTWSFALVVVRLGQRFLLVQEKKHEHAWYLPAGRVRRGEALVDAAVRETLEESGVRIQLTGIHKFEYTPDNNGARLRVFFVGTPVGDPTPKVTSDEHSLGARWVTLQELDALPLRGCEVRDACFAIASGSAPAPLAILSTEAGRP